MEHRPCLTTFKWLLHGLRFVQFCRLLGILKNAFTTHPSLLLRLTFINNSNFCLNLGGGGNNYPEWKFQPELLNLRRTLTSWKGFSSSGGTHTLNNVYLHGGLRQKLFLTCKYPFIPKVCCCFFIHQIQQETFTCCVLQFSTSISTLK